MKKKKYKKIKGCEQFNQLESKISYFPDVSLMSVPDLDWEQPQFFFRFSEGSSRAREQRRET